MTGQQANQAARYTAIVSASAASLTLTVAAGAYVMSQISPSASSTAPATTLDRPDRSVVEVEPRIARAFTAAAPGVPAPASFAVGGAEGRVRAAVTEPAADPVDLPAGGEQAGAQPAPARRSESGGHLDLGVAEVDTRRDEQRTTVTLTIDPEVTAALYGALTDFPTAPGDSTTLSTEIDRGRGGVAVGFSDPVLGERSVEMPGTTPPARPTGPLPSA
ncbi:hypothetical protein [Nocardia shimofusensis]|uniref:hypothetical protein n=1 Tax=Nocardia shimofusensis TaxID=228596 RepID=UPI000A4FF372|nr:hypothetical protein [Nocardia shimofusensis]